MEQSRTISEWYLRNQHLYLVGLVVPICLDGKEDIFIKEWGLDAQVMTTHTMYKHKYIHVYKFIVHLLGNAPMQVIARSDLKGHMNVPTCIQCNFNYVLN